MKKIKRLGFLIAILCIFAVCFGVGCSDVVNSIGGKTDKYEIEPSDKNTVGLRFDAEDDSFVWKPQEGVKSYDLYLEDLMGKKHFVNFKQAKDLQIENGEIGFNARSELEKYAEALQGGCYALLTAYDNDNAPTWAIRTPFDFLAVSAPTLDEKTGTISWAPVEGAASYLYYDGNDKYELTEPQISTDLFLRGSYYINYTQIKAVGPKGGQWISLAYEDFKFLYAPTPTEVEYRGDSIYWRQDISKYTSQDQGKLPDFTYEIEIFDGKTSFKDYVKGSYYGGSYAYQPQTDDFSYTLRALGASSEKSGKIFAPGAAIEKQEECFGSVSDFAYDANKKQFSWQNIEGAWDYKISVDGEEIARQSENILREDLFADDYGEKEITVYSFIDGGYYIPLREKVYFITAPIVTLRPTEDEKISVQVENLDEKISSCTIDMYNVKDSAISQKTPIGEKVEVIFDAPDGYKSYRLCATPEVNMEGISVVRLGEDTISRVNYYGVEEIYYNNDGTARLGMGLTAKYEYEINGVTTCQETGYIPIPESFSSQANEQETVIRIRALDKDEPQASLPSFWQEYTVRLLGQVQNFHVENGSLHWDYKGNWDYKPVYQLFSDNEEKTLYGNSYELKLSEAGLHVFQVRALPRNEKITDNLIYIRGMRDALSLTLLYTPKVNGLTQEGKGITWSEDSKAEGYRICIGGQELTVSDSSLDCCEYLKEKSTQTLTITALGDGVNTLDSAPYSYTITRETDFQFALSNANENLSWTSKETYDRIDYQVISPTGEIAYEGAGVTDGKTSALRLVEKGEYVLRLFIAPTLFADRAYLHTGEEALDCVEQTFYKSYLEYTVSEGGQLQVTHQPALPQKAYTLDLYAYNPDGEYSFSVYDSNSVGGTFSYARDAFHDGNEYKKRFNKEGTWTLEPHFKGGETADYDSVFAFQSNFTNHYVNVKKTPTVDVKLTYIPAEKYKKGWMLDGELKDTTVKNKENALKISADCAVEGTEYLFTFYDGEQYIKHHLDENGMVIAYDEFLPVSVTVTTNYFTSANEYCFGSAISTQATKEDIKENHKPVTLYFQMSTNENYLGVMYRQIGSIVATVTHNGVTTVLTASPFKDDYVIVEYTGTDENPLLDSQEIIFRFYVEESDGLWQSDIVGVYIEYEDRYEA